MLEVIVFVSPNIISLLKGAGFNIGNLTLTLI